MIGMMIVSGYLFKKMSENPLPSGFLSRHGVKEKHQPLYQKLVDDMACPYPDLMTVQMIAELTGYSVKTVRRWTAFGHIRWFQNGLKHLAPKELVIRHMMSENFRTIANKSWKHDKIIQQLIDATNKEDKKHV